MSLRRAAGLAESLGAVPLVWPARAMLGALVAESAPAEGARALASAQAVVRQIARDLPEPYAGELARAPRHRRPHRGQRAAAGPGRRALSRAAPGVRGSARRLCVK